MRTRSKSWTFVMTVATFGLAGLASALPTVAQTAQPGGQHRLTATATTGAELTTPLVDDLEARGFQVSPGYPMVWGPGACETNLSRTEA